MEWSGVEWSGVEWSGVEWSGVEWSGVEWSGVEWSGVEWSGVEWSGVEWSGVEWSGVEWSGVEWSGVEWSGVEWSGVEWSGVEWSGVECSGVECSGVECSGVEWSGVEWSGVEWSGVEWSGVEWSGVEWSGVEWSGVEWSGVVRSGVERGGLEWRKWERWGGRGVYIILVSYRHVWRGGGRGRGRGGGDCQIWWNTTPRHNNASSRFWKIFTKNICMQLSCGLVVVAQALRHWVCHVIWNNNGSLRTNENQHIESSIVHKLCMRSCDVSVVVKMAPSCEDYFSSFSIFSEAHEVFDKSMPQRRQQRESSRPESLFQIYGQHI